MDEAHAGEKMDERGIDPRTSRMLSERSTIELHARCDTYKGSKYCPYTLRRVVRRWCSKRWPAAP